MNDLKERIESNVVNRTFSASGMPETVFKEVNAFCKEFYGDSRWVMIADLMRMAKEDIKFTMLYDELAVVKGRVAKLEEQKSEKKPSRVTTFGARKVNENE